MSVLYLLNIKKGWIILTVGSGILLTLVKLEKAWEFHGAEHKTLKAVENEMELTLDNVRNCPRVIDECGTNLVLITAIVNVIFSILVPFRIINIPLICITAYELRDLFNNNKLPILSHVFKLGSWLQDKVVTKEPTSEQIEASILIMKKILELEDNHSALKAE